MQFLAEKHALKQPAAKAAAARAVGAARGSGSQRKGGATAARLRASTLAPVAEAEESVLAVTSVSGPAKAVFQVPFGNHSRTSASSRAPASVLPGFARSDTFIRRVCALSPALHVCALLYLSRWVSLRFVS